MDQFERMREIEEYFTKLCKKHTIKTMCMEKLFFTKFNQNNAEFGYGIRAILITLCLKNNIRIRGHALVWHEALPQWVWDLYNNKIFLFR